MRLRDATCAILLILHLLPAATAEAQSSALVLETFEEELPAAWETGGTAGSSILVAWTEEEGAPPGAAEIRLRLHYLDSPGSASLSSPCIPVDGIEEPIVLQTLARLDSGSEVACKAVLFLYSTLANCESNAFPFGNEQPPSTQSQLFELMRTEGIDLGSLGAEAIRVSIGTVTDPLADPGPDDFLEGTCFFDNLVVAEVGQPSEIPTVSALGLAILGLLLAGFGVALRRQHRRFPE